jgi:hypothetical protein
MSISADTNLANCLPTHVAYADEASYNTGRYRGIALVTLSISDAKSINAKLQRIWNELSVKEFKWSKLKSVRSRMAALKIVDLTISLLVSEVARVDVLTWDMEDSRHRMRRRSDIRNLRRMYYFLFRNVLGRRWPDTCYWELRPDESSFGADSHLRYLDNPDEMNEDARRARVYEIAPIDSRQEPLAQVADFFAGIAVYSRKSFNTYEVWSKTLSPSRASTETAELSNADKERCHVLEHLYRQCKERKFPVSLPSAKGLRTRDPHCPINFWWYEPQGDYDIAPIWH